MMLPIVTTTANAGVSETAGSATGLLASEQLPQDFVQLLSLHLPNKAATTGLTADNASALSGKDSKQKLLDALTAQDIDLSQQDLNTLLTTLGGQDNLDDKTLAEVVNSLRKSLAQGLGNSTEKSTDDTHATDTQAVQALMAMLSPTTMPVQQNNEMSSLLQGTQSLSLTGLSNTVAQNKNESATTSLLNALDPRDALTSKSNTLTTAVTNAKNSRSAANDQSQIQPQTDDSAQTLDKSAGFAHAATEMSRQDISSQQTPLTGHTAAVTLAPNAQTSITNNIAQPSASAQLNAQLGTTQWQDSLGQQIVMLSRNGQQSAQLRLHPEELGTLHISLRLDDNQAQIHLASANSQVRSALEAALPHLRSAMAENGISLGQSSVGGENSGWEQAQQQMASNTNGNFGDDSASYRQQFAATAHYDNDPIELDVSSTVRSRPVSGVDIFA